MLKSTLSQEGYDVYLAKDGHESYNLIMDNEFDCILININLHRKTGLHVIETIRKIPHYKDTLIISFLDDYDEENENKSYEVGADKCMVKPLDIKKLLRILREI